MLDLRSEVDNRGLKIIWIAKRAGVSKAYISLILAGKRTPPKPLLKKLIAIITGKIHKRNAA